MQTGTWKAVILLLLAAALGGAVGSIVTARTMEHHHDRNGGPGRGSEWYVNLLSKELDLSRPQQDSVRAVLRLHRGQMDSLWATLGPQMEQMRQAIRADVRALLTSRTTGPLHRGDRPPGCATAREDEGGLGQAMSPELRTRTGWWARAALTLALFAAPRGAWAQTPTVTLEEAVRLAQRAVPGVIQAEGAVRNADAQVRSAKGAYLPNLNANSSGSRNFSDGPSRVNSTTGEVQSGNSATTNVNMGLSASVDLFTGFRRGADSRAARATQNAAEAGLTDAQFQARLTRDPAVLRCAGGAAAGAGAGGQRAASGGAAQPRGRQAACGLGDPVRFAALAGEPGQRAAGADHRRRATSPAPRPRWPGHWARMAG